MISWTLRSSTAPGLVYERELGLCELNFHYRGHVLGGATDTIQEIAFQVSEALPYLSDKTVQDAWIAVKHKYPLLGAYIDVLGPKDTDVHFVVDTALLQTCAPDEMTSFPMSSIDEVKTFMHDMMNTPRILDNKRLARLFFLRRTDTPNCYHILVHAAHCIIDGISYYTIMREMLEILSRISTQLIAHDDLEARLSLSLPTDNHLPIRRLNIARQRWQRAIAAVIHTLRLRTTVGGQTLPGNFTACMNERAAYSCFTLTAFTESQSTAISKGCRKLGITFGNAFLILGQLGMARVICRHYAEGLISQQEWDWRRKEPFWAAGPLNIRPYLDQQWLHGGGAENVMLAIGFFFYKIPLMPLKLADDKTVLDFQHLLSPERFVYRSKMMTKQSNGHTRHPLFTNIVAARFPAMIQDTKNLGFKMQRPISPQDDIPLDVHDMAKRDLVVAMGGSSFGRTDDVSPRSYPTAPGASPTIHVLYGSTRLRCRPGELYLGSSSWANIMHMHVFWDRNVFEDSLVNEWLTEVKSATLFYLGREEMAKL